MHSASQSHRSVVARRVAIAFFLIPALAVAALLVWRIELHFRLQSELASIRKAGLPTSGGELNAYLPKVPDSENGGVALGKAFARLHDFRGDGSNTFAAILDMEPSARWSPEARALVEQHLQTNRQALAEIHAALERSTRFQFPVDYSAGAGVGFPHLKH